jgi:transcriptional regulator with XRE-family HTH domain
MSFRSLREHKHLSQEQLAAKSGLSLRTIQRVEAGHRVGFASLRTLAATFEMDVDVLERELYAVNKTEEFVEIPRWVRLWNEGMWYGRPYPTRRAALCSEAVLMGLAMACFIASLIAKQEGMVTILRFAAFWQLAAGYLMSIGIRIADSYALWPASPGATPDALRAYPTRPYSRLVEYSGALAVGVIATISLCWLLA